MIFLKIHLFNKSSVVLNHSAFFIPKIRFVRIRNNAKRLSYRNKGVTMAEENTNTQVTSEQNADSAENNEQNKGAENTASSKKYTDDEVNGIVAKKTGKAVDKFLKDLGITDRAAAETALKEFAAKSAKEKNHSEANAELNAKLKTANYEKDMALLESVMLISGVQPSKVEKAVKLIELEDCRDEDGAFDREKAKTAVEALLKDWGELKTVREENSSVGFKIGSDGKGSDDKKAPKPKTVPQKSWNKFNY